MEATTEAVVRGCLAPIGCIPSRAPAQPAWLTGVFPPREGSLKAGDRLLSVDGIPLHGASHATALATLRQCSHEALFQVEYDVAAPGQPGPAGKAGAGGAGVGCRFPPLHRLCALGPAAQPLWAMSTVHQALLPPWGYPWELHGCGVCHPGAKIGLGRGQRTE